MFWSVQSIATEIYPNEPMIIEFYEYEKGKTGTAIAVMLAFFGLFRIIQMLGYIYLHNPQK